MGRRREPHETNTLAQDAEALIYARGQAARLAPDPDRPAALTACLAAYEHSYNAARRRALVADVWRVFLPAPYDRLPLGWIPSNRFGAGPVRSSPLFALKRRVATVLDRHNVTRLADEGPALRTQFLRALALDSPHKRRGGRKPRKQ